MEVSNQFLHGILQAIEKLGEKLDTIAHNQRQTVATPAISCTDNTVTISCATSGAEIHYTTDGSEPTAASDAYSAPVAITVTKTFKAIAMKMDMNDSAVATALCEYVEPEPVEPEPEE